MLTRIYALACILFLYCLLHPTPSFCATPASSSNLNTQLIAAINKKDVDEVKQILGRGADANAEDSHGGTALLFGISTKNTEIVTLLLNAGADVNHCFPLGGMLLSEASDDLPMLNLLLERGADPNLQCPARKGAHDYEPFVRATPLMYASSLDSIVSDDDHLPAAQILIGHGAKIDARFRRRDRAILRGGCPWACD